MQNKAKSFKLGITGGSGAGTSTATDFFHKRGVPVIYADKLAKDCTVSNSPALRKIKKVFPSCFDKKGMLNRKLLGKLVFSNDSGSRLKVLNDIIHPLVLKKMLEFIKMNSQSRIIVLDIPLLFEVGFERYLDGVLVITCPEAIRLKRLHKRDGLSYNELRKRFSHQMSPNLKKKKANWAISNRAGYRDFIGKLKKFYREISYEIEAS